MGTKLRPEADNAKSWEKLTPRNEALRLLWKAVARRRSLIRGKLWDGDKVCAIGALGRFTGGISVEAAFVDEVAAVNDQLSDRVTQKRRWQHVMKWLRKEIAKLDSEANRAGVTK